VIKKNFLVRFSETDLPKKKKSMKRNVLLGKKNAGHVINYLIIKENTAQHIHRLKPSLKNKNKKTTTTTKVLPQN